MLAIVDQPSGDVNILYAVAATPPDATATATTRPIFIAVTVVDKGSDFIAFFMFVNIFLAEDIIDEALSLTFLRAKPPYLETLPATLPNAPPTIPAPAAIVSRKSSSKTLL